MYTHVYAFESIAKPIVLILCMVYVCACICVCICVCVSVYVCRGQRSKAVHFLFCFIFKTCLFLIMCMCLCMNLPAVSVDAYGGWRYRIPWSCSYRLLSHLTCEQHWELNSGPREEQCMCLATELSLQPVFVLMRRGLSLTLPGAHQVH